MSEDKRVIDLTGAPEAIDRYYARRDAIRILVIVVVLLVAIFLVPVAASWLNDTFADLSSETA